MKYKVFMAACQLFASARHIFYLSCRDTLDGTITEEMELFATTHVDEFLKRCRTMSKTWNEKRYVSHVANKHVKAIISYSFDEHLKRLNRVDTLNILNNNDTVPRFLIMELKTSFKEKQLSIEKKFKTQIIII